MNKIGVQGGKSGVGQQKQSIVPFYRMKNSIHVSDREKASQIVENFVMPKNPKSNPHFNKKIKGVEEIIPNDK